MTPTNTDSALKIIGKAWVHADPCSCRACLVAEALITHPTTTETGAKHED